MAELEPEALGPIAPILCDRRGAVLARIERDGPQLRETFESLRALEYRRSFDECVDVVRAALAGTPSR